MNEWHCRARLNMQEHMQNMDQLHAYDCHQNVTEPQSTEYHIKKYTRIQHKICESDLAIIL